MNSRHARDCSTGVGLSTRARFSLGGDFPREGLEIHGLWWLRPMGA